MAGEIAAPPAPATEAPAAAEKPVQASGQPPAEAPAKARTPDDDFEEVLKKSGGLKYKAGGKEKTIGSTADLRRLLSRVDGTESAASQALKDRQEAASFKQQVASFDKLPAKDRIKALQGIGLNPKTVREAFEEHILEEEAKEKALEALTPKERELQTALEKQEAELSGYRTAREQWEAEQVQNEQVAKVNETYGRLEKVAVGALKKAKIAGDHAPKFLHVIADHLDRNERLQLGHDEDELAEVVMKEHESLADQYYGGLEVPALADKLEGMSVPDPTDTSGKKTTTRLRLLMLECAARLRAKVNGGEPAPVLRSVPQPSEGGVSVAEKMRRARTFGGGGF